MVSHVPQNENTKESWDDRHLICCNGNNFQGAERSFLTGGFEPMLCPAELRALARRRCGITSRPPLRELRHVIGPDTRLTGRGEMVKLTCPRNALIGDSRGR